jgi:hypothetical protein
MKFGVNVIVYALRDLHGKTAKHTAAEEVNDAVE